MSEPKKSALHDHSQELFRDAQKELYKSVGGIDLPLYIFRPKENASDKPRPVILFFYSSLWDKGRVSQFAPQCTYFSQRGAVSVAVDYRISDRDGTSAIDAMSDARDAIRWVRLNADALNINSEWVVAAGGTAGAHLALSTAMVDNPIFTVPDEDLRFSHTPNALLLYSPIIDPAPLNTSVHAFADQKLARMADAARYVRKDLPPMAIFHGTADQISPIRPAIDFSRKMEKKGNRCDIFPFEGSGSGFFNFNVDPQCYEAVLLGSEDFLVDLGFLDPPESEEDGYASMESRLSG